MNHWLEAEPEEILDEVVLARQVAGEELDDSSQKTRAMIQNDIGSSQRHIAASVVQSGVRIAVSRSMTLEPEEIDGRRGDMEIVIEAVVSTDHIVWPMVIGMWSSDEGEARLDRRARVSIREIRSRSGDPVREDLWGVEHSLHPTRVVAAP